MEFVREGLCPGGCCCCCFGCCGCGCCCCWAAAILALRCGGRYFLGAAEWEEEVETSSLAFADGGGFGEAVSGAVTGVAEEGNLALLKSEVNE